jgi:hypothetical protein
MKVYIDTNCRCHATDPDGTLRAVHDPFFDGKAPSVIEGYLFVPEGETVTGADGTVITGGPMIAPWRPSNTLTAAQAQYDYDQAALAAAYQEGVNSI